MKRDRKDIEEDAKQSRKIQNNNNEVFGPTLVKHKSMDVVKEFEAVQESFNERLSKQDDGVEKNEEGTKKIKRKHIV